MPNDCIDLSQPIKLVHECDLDLECLTNIAKENNLVLEMLYCPFEQKEAPFLFSEERLLQHYNMKDLIRNELIQKSRQMHQIIFEECL